jgi:hypothetical protein
MTDWLNVRNETVTNLDVYFGGVTSISSGVNEFLRLEVPRFKLTKYPTEVTGPGIVTVGIEGVAEYHSGSGTVCLFTLSNTFADYSA